MLSGRLCHSRHSKHSLCIIHAHRHPCTAASRGAGNGVTSVPRPHLYIKYRASLDDIQTFDVMRDKSLKGFGSPPASKYSLQNVIVTDPHPPGGDYVVLPHTHLRCACPIKQPLGMALHAALVSSNSFLMYAYCLYVFYSTILF